nr:hypothetical protein B0A51_11750 [Rachicladosporium sp. CCFEE 5018]
MPEARALHSTATSTDFDDPPAGPTPSYPNRHVRLRRALRDTSVLAREIQRDTPVSSSSTPPTAPAYWPRREAALRRARIRARETEAEAEAEDDSDHRGGSTPRRSNKRRKLTSDSPLSTKPPIKYGHYGQVVAGPLQMQIVSNDGGEHVDPNSPGIYLGQENLLKGDRSVYCSERSSVGVTLRQADGGIFSLEKLYIVGPEHGFTAPVREGLVYVAMNLKDLEPYRDPPTYARRAGIDTPPYYRRRSIQASPERLSLSEALRDEELDRELAARADLAGTSAWLRNPPNTRRPPESHHDPYLDFAPPADNLACDFPAPTDALGSTIPVTISSDDELTQQEDESSQDVIDYRIRRLRLMRRQTQVYGHNNVTGYSAEEAERLIERASNARYSGGSGAAPEDQWSYTRLEELMSHRSRPHLSAARIPAPEELEQRPTRPTNASAGDPNVTSARFRMRNGKHSIALKFSPPVSGKYVLLKLWSGVKRDNVDVQSIVVKGFSGMRFHAAVEMV